MTDSVHFVVHRAARAALAALCALIFSRASAVDLDQFFCINAIQPYHEYKSPDPKVREKVWETLDHRLQLAKELGIHGVRIDMWWGVIEPEKDRFEWDFPDRVIEHIVKAGLEPYPILCYNPAWSPDASPADDDARERFTLYASELVKRNRGRVKYYEVWNEPNIVPFWVPAPDPALYAPLLKSVYTAAKESDPDCVIVAMCTAGPDYKFIDAVYREGAAAYLDAVSFHRYDATKDESLLENEIRQIRRIMERYGDVAKPLLITELGYTTGPSEVSKPVSYEDQAEWATKSYLLALAEGVDQFYYFKMVDDYFENNPDGLWGFLEHDYKEKPSWQAVKAMTTRLKGGKFLGRAHRIGREFERRDEVEFQLYENGGEYLACAWVRKNGEPMSIELPADAPIQVEDLCGKSVETIVPQEGGLAVVKLTHEPVYLRKLSRNVVPLATVKLSPENLFIAPNETRTIEMSATNPTDEPLEIRLDPFFYPRKSLPVTFSSRMRLLEVPARQSASFEITATRSTDAADFLPHAVQFYDTAPYSYGMTVYPAKAFDVRVFGSRREAELILTTSFQNQTSSSVKGIVKWTLSTLREPVEMPYPTIIPGGQGEVSLPLAMRVGETVVESVVEGSNSITGTGRLLLWGQQIVPEAIQVDGEPNEWADIAAVRLTPQLHQLKPDPLKTRLDPANFSAQVRAAWTADTFFLCAEVVDSTPLVNPHQGPELWRGDSMELYIGFNGPSTKSQYGEGEFQIGVHPGNNGRDAYLWNWKPLPVNGVKAPPEGRRIENATIVSRAIDSGYLVELAIPLDTIGQQVQDGQLLGFSLHINNKDSPKSESSDGVIAWNGTDADWKDPSYWGVARVMSGPFLGEHGSPTD